MPEIPLVRHDWMDDAACITIPGFTELPIIEQVLTCGACPVKEPCKAYGIKQDEPRLSVVYGGLTGRQLAAAAKAAGIEPIRSDTRAGAHGRDLRPRLHRVRPRIHGEPSAGQVLHQGLPDRRLPLPEGVMLTVIGLDPSLSATGVATAGGQVSLATKPAKTLPTRLARLYGIVEEVAARTPEGSLVVIEAPAYSRANAGTHVGAGLWWLLVAMLDARGCALVQVAPTTLKKFATGKGTASKPDMRMALYKRAGLDLADDNHVDAWWLRQVGLHLLHHPDAVDLPKAQRDAVEGLRVQLSSDC